MTKGWVICLVIFGFTGGFVAQDLTSVTRAAFLQIENNEGTCQHGEQSYWGISCSEIKSARWSNFKKYIPDLVKTQNVVRVGMSKTTDSGVWVISISDPTGKASSFWLDSGSPNGGNVTAITSY